MRLPLRVKRKIHGVRKQIKGYVSLAAPALRRTFQDFGRNDYMMYAAALSFYFLLSLFPLLIFLASLLVYVPIPDLFEQALQTMSRVVPVETMQIVRSVVADILATRPELVSFSVASAIVAASSGFSAMITALNVTYDVPEGRPFWKKRLVAIGLTILAGAMMVIALVAIAVGPQFGSWLAALFGADPVFAYWPAFRWMIVLTFTILAVEALYFLAPNIKQRFQAQVPGAVIAVAALVVLSNAFGWYLRHLADYGKTYGALGAVIALMLWLYLGGLAILLGAEFNAELLKQHGERLPIKKQVEGPAGNAEAA